MHVCPNCGYCPHCGRADKPRPIGVRPWPWTQPRPYTLPMGPIWVDPSVLAPYGYPQTTWISSTTNVC